MPAVFVVIWSTGFVVARYGMPHAPPFAFLAVRFILSALLLGVWAQLAGAAWPASRGQWRHLAITGVLMHGGYLGGVWAAVRWGIGAGTVALIVGLQPLLTTLWVEARHRSSITGAAHERLGPRHWIGLLMGLCGLALVVGPKLGHGEVTPVNLVLALLALLSITAGTLYQKHHVQPCDVRTAGAVQMVAALVVAAPIALGELTGGGAHVDLHPELIGAMAWSVLALTLGGSSLLYLLIARGAATRVTSLMYLVPPCTAVLAWLLFDEVINVSMVAGMALSLAGVLLVVRAGRGRS
ncbi:DMT family transporter [Leptothrix discophora]|uniref:DMT family transporter n=1 Tax=Leptothrix discophora TaxID=89 RepID=A0ABT9FZ53_LEPDI|nr:DMT family transporter [Leptothrix discophora]MDP4299511.1 DMT family transporter [Leptothrix discophora]